MRNRMRSVGIVVIGLACTLMLTGCPKRPGTMGAAVPPPEGGSSAGMTDGTVVATTMTRSDGSSGQSSSSSTGSGGMLKPSDFVATVEMKDIHFDFDKADIRVVDADVLEANARWLRSNPGVQVLVEGHCDDRGTVEYNLALGQRRAKAAQDFLTAHGVAATRITTISYGKERPACTAQTEACWAKNRRDRFLVQAR